MTRGCPSNGPVLWPYAGTWVVAQMIAADLRVAQRFATLDQQYVKARIRQHLRGNAAAGARPDHDRVVLGAQLIDARGWLWPRFDAL